jgi:hypothetical protein
MLTLDQQPRRALAPPVWDRFTGLAAARRCLGAEPALAATRVAVVDVGKNAWAIERALDERGDCTLVPERTAEVVVIGTLSPGPMMDAWAGRVANGRPVLRPWSPAHAPRTLADGAHAGAFGGSTP